MSQMTMEVDATLPERKTKRISPLMWVILIIVAMVAAMFVKNSVGESHAERHTPHAWGVGILPFIGILACIAFLPLIRNTEHWWHSNKSKLLVSGIVAGGTLLYYLLAEGATSIGHVLDHAILGEYIPFIILLFSLYAISGGISLTGDLAAKPLTNTTFLAFGALIASVVGTTGASMLLIRPILQTNSERKRVVHTVIFFIFLVSNVGGCLLPIGDPPLFLGFLKGIPFFWTLGLLWPWLLCTSVLLVIYFIWDTIAYRKEEVSSIQRDELIKEPLRLRGWSNIFWLFGVVLCVALIDPKKEFFGTGYAPPPFLREMLMLLFVCLSLRTTPAGLREKNRFDYFAIIEDAVLFLGIFIAMQVPVALLSANGSELGINHPAQFFWATGGLSSFLDNAPTYVVFFETAASMDAGDAATVTFNGGGVINESFLIAISLGAVFMGAMTYIGNGPNFMVKSIAEQSGVRMPSFFGYMRYSLFILVPVLFVIMFIFLL